jgi:hypothetical protein
MLKSVDRIADQWIDQLKHVRDNTQAVEQMVLSAITRVKHSITELHLLGTAVMLEAKRGEEVCTELADKIEQAMTTHQ